MSTQVRQVVSNADSDIHDEPHIEGRRVTVLQIYERVEGRGLDPDTVAARFDLDVAAVYHALAYYHDHPAEMAAVRDDREQAEADIRGRVDRPDGVSPSPATDE